VKARIFGYETEYGVIIFPGEGKQRVPRRMKIYDYLEYLVSARGKVLQAIYRKKGIFTQNGGLLNYEALQSNFFEGLVETATPECRSAREVALYHEAQTRMLFDVMEELNARAGELEPGFDGTVTLGKSNVDAEGKYFASHENYLVDDEPGGFSKIALFLLVPPMWLLHLLLTIVSFLPLVVAAPFIILFVLVTSFISGLLQNTERFRSQGASMSDFLMNRVLSEEFLINYIALPQGEFAKLLYMPWVFLASRLIMPHAFKRYRSELVPFLVTRTLLSGTGRVHLPQVTSVPGEDEPVKKTIFELSQRARAIRSVCRIYFDDDLRPIIDAREFLMEPLSMLRKKKRLHILFSDTNMSSIGVYLKMGITALIIEMIEAGETFPDLHLADPLQALCDINGDISLKARLPLANGGEMTALQIQKSFLDRAKTYFSAHSPGDREVKELLEKWEYILGCLEITPQLLYRKVDWVTKKDLIEEVLRGRATLTDLAEVAPWISFLIHCGGESVPRQDYPLRYFRGIMGPEASEAFERFLAQRSIGYQEFLDRWRLYYEVLKIDFKFHQLDREGYYYRLQQSELVDRLFDDEEIARAQEEPPASTRASLRGGLIRRYGAASGQQAFEVEKEISQQSRVRIGWNAFYLNWPLGKVSLGDVFNTDQAAVDREIDRKSGSAPVD